MAYRPRSHGGLVQKDQKRRAGTYLAQLRRAQELTQRDLAEAIGLRYYTFISQIEVGEAVLPEYLWSATAEALHVEPVAFAQRLLACYHPPVYQMLYGDAKRGSKARG